MAVPLVDADPPLRVAVLASSSHLRLAHLLEDDPNRGDAYELVGAVTNVADGDAESLLREHGVLVTCHDIHAFYETRGADIGDLTVREAFDERVAATLAGYDPDLVVLSGYLHVVTEPVLDRFGPAILNVHHGDLAVVDETGHPVYDGLRSVEAAIRAGEDETRETVHVVTETVDAGPLIARSRPFAVQRALVDAALARGDDALLDAYVYAHRRWLLREGGGPTLAMAIELVADGRVTHADGQTFVDGEPGVYQLGDDGGPGG